MAQDLHATDDQGFPLRPYCCEACLALSKRMNEEYMRRVFDCKGFTQNFETNEPDWTKP